MTTTTTASPHAQTVPTAAKLEAELVQRLSPTYVHVLDESAAHAGHAGANGLGYGTHFRVRIAGAAFAGKSRVAAHRLVYDALHLWMAAGVHALAIEVIEVLPTPETR